ncbi:MAG: type IV pilus modification PilV family protein [Pseudomonadota bacterium]
MMGCITRSIGVKLHCQSGFTLLEVLISIVVVALGVMGTALLQLNSLKGAEHAYEVSLANLVAQDVKELLWATQLVAADVSSGVASSEVSCPTHGGITVDGESGEHALPLPFDKVGNDGDGLWWFDVDIAGLGISKGDQAIEVMAFVVDSELDEYYPFPSGDSFSSSGNFPFISCDYLVSVDWGEGRLEAAPTELSYRLRLPGSPLKYLMYKP